MSQHVVRSVEEAQALELAYPVECLPSFTLGGQGRGLAYDRLALIGLVRTGLDASPTGEVLLKPAKTMGRVPPEHEWDDSGKCKWCPAQRTGA